MPVIKSLPVDVVLRLLFGLLAFVYTMTYIVMAAALEFDVADYIGPPWHKH